MFRFFFGSSRRTEEFSSWNAWLASGTAEFFKIRRYQRVPSKKTLQMVECKANEGHPESTIRNHLRWKSTAQVDGGFQGTLEAERTNCKKLFDSSLRGLMRKSVLLLVFWGMTIPFMVWAESPWEMDPKKYRPALPPWLIPLNKSESSNQPNAFHPEIYLYWQEQRVRGDQLKIQQMIKQERRTGMRQHTRLKYDSQSKIAKNCSIAKCSQ